MSALTTPSTRVVVVLDATSPHSRSVIDALLRQNREERQRLRNAVAAHLIASYNAAPAPPPPASAGAVGSPTTTTAVTVLSPVSGGTNGGGGGGSGLGASDGLAVLPPLLSSPITWPGASAMSNVPADTDDAHTHIVHVDCEGRVCHVGLNDPVCDQLKRMRKQSEEVLRRWKREREMEEAAHAARGGRPEDEMDDGNDDEEEEELTPSPSSSAASTVRPPMIGSIDSALRLQAVAASSRRSNSDSSGSDASGAPRRAITLLPPPAARSVGCPPRRSASSSSIAPPGSVGGCGEAVLTEEELELELERAVREAYVQPWIVRVVADGIEAGKLQANGVRVVRDEESAFEGAWAVFAAFFDDKGLPVVKEDRGQHLLAAATKARVQHLIVCSMIDLVPSTHASSTPSSILQTRALSSPATKLSSPATKTGSPTTVTLLSTALTFETALEQKFISIARGTSTSAPSSSTNSALHYVLHARFATHKYLPWSSSADVGPATLAVLSSMGGMGGMGGVVRHDDVSLVSDHISAHEARAQCSQIVYVTNKRITTRESRGEAREMTPEVRALIDYWCKHSDDVRKAVAMAQKETARRGLRLTGWREFAFQKIDSLIPGWKDGVTASSSSSSRASVAAAARAAAALAATTPGGSPQPPDRYVTAPTPRRADGSPLGSEALSYVAGHQWSPRPASGSSTGSASTPGSKTESRPASSYFDGLHK